MNLIKQGPVNPTVWSTATLVSLGDHVIHELALNSVGIDTAYRVTLGRCLLAVEETKLYQRFGCSGAVHYGTSRLGIGVRHARTVRRVAKALEGLPRLSIAAERGEIAWGKLREIVSKASAETESTWLTLAHERSYTEIERLVRATELGKLPWDPSAVPEPETKLRLHFASETGEIFERARALLSERFEKPISISEALEHLSLEFLAGKKLTAEKVKNAKIEARRGSCAAKRRDARLVEKAKEAVETRGEQAILAHALGASSLAEDDPHGTSSEADHQSAGSSPPQPEVADSRCKNSSQESPNQHVLKFERPARVTTEPNIKEQNFDEREAQERESNLPTSPVKVPSGQETVTRGSHEPELAAHSQTHDWKNPRLRFNVKARSATPAQRREILRRDAYCCSTPGCPNRHWLELHHVVPFSRKGETLPRNLITLCSRCHKHFHDGHLRIEVASNSGYIFKDAYGRDLEREARIEIAGWVNFWLGWEGGPENCYIRRWAMAA